MGHDCSPLSATRVPTANFCFSGFEGRGRHPCRSFSFRRREWRRHTGLILMPLLVLAHDTDKDAKSDLIAGVSARISAIFPCVVAIDELRRNYPSQRSIKTANLTVKSKAGQERSSVAVARQPVSKSAGQPGFRTMRFNAITWRKNSFRGCAGLPSNTAPAGTSEMTPACAPICAPCPISRCPAIAAWPPT